MTVDVLPSSGLELSVLVAVLLGTLVLAYLSEALGWSFGGLVVPGYLAAVLAISPAAGATVVAEAALTAVVTTLLSDGLARTGIWSPFFGRERFLVLVLVSVLVRQASEVWLLRAVLTLQEPLIGRVWIEADEAHSVGLVLVPLAANALAKSRTLDGVAQLVLPTALTWAVLAGIVLPHTNLSLAALSLTYEDSSLDFLHSARAYFVLCTGAFLAARLNGALAWSAGGILIPALMGLAWYEPTRLVATLLEAALVAAVYLVSSRLPAVQRLRLEGSRQLAALFTLATGLRVALAWAHWFGWPVHGTLEGGIDLSGLGFLVSALIAAKIIQLRSFATPTLPAIGTSFIAFVGGSAAALLFDRWLPAPPDSSTQAIAASQRTLATPQGVAEYAIVRARSAPQTVSSGALRAWRRWWDQATDANPLPPAPPGMQLSPGNAAGQRPWWVLHEATEALDDLDGWGVAWLRPGAPGPLVVVERPWSNPHAARTAPSRCLELDCFAVLFSGVDSGEDPVLAEARAGRRSVVLHTGVAAPLHVTARASVADVVWAAMEGPRLPWAPSPTELEIFSATLAPALAGADPTSAAAAAGALGLVLEEVPCGGGRCWAVRPKDARTAGPVVVTRPGGEPVMVSVTHPGEIGTVHLGLSTFHTLRARVLVIDPTEAPADARAIDDPSHALFLGWRRALAAETDSAAVWVRGFGDAPERRRPSSPVVVGLGFPAPPPPWTPPAPVAKILTALGAPADGVWLARADHSDVTLVGSSLVGPRAARALGGPPPVVLWFSHEQRASLRAEGREAFAAWVRAAGLDVLDRSADTPPVVADRSSSSVAIDLARRAARQHNLDLLRGLAQLGGVSAGWDPDRGLGFLEVAGAESTTRTWVSAGSGPLVSVPAVATAEQIRAAVGVLPHDVQILVEGP